MIRSLFLTRTPLRATFIVCALAACPAYSSAQVQADPNVPVAHPATGHARRGPVSDFSEPDPTIEPGTILVQVVDAAGNPAPGAQVELTSLFQSIDRGNSEETKTLAVNANGEARFTQLQSALRLSYQIRVKSEGANYDLPAFRLVEIGHRAIVHVYPTTSNIKDAFVGFRGLTYVQMREDFFHVNVMYRVMNMSQKTYLPQDITITVPENAQAIDVQAKSGDAGFSNVGRKVTLVGSFPPGTRDLQFTFQLENKNEKNLAFEINPPPHLAEQRILVEETPGMELSVPGFGSAESTPGPDGKPVLFAQKIMQPGESSLASVRIELGGLPTIGPGRWLALAIAFVIGLGGICIALFQKKGQESELLEQRKQARTVLLNEMKLLERARRQDKIGPRTYEQTRREILLALARLEPKTS